MSEITFDIADLTEAATDLEATATVAVTEVIATTLGVAIRNDCWGTDQIGGAFAHAYLAPAEEAMRAVQQISYQIGSIAEGLQTAARGYETTEQTNVEEAGSIET